MNTRQQNSIQRAIDYIQSKGGKLLTSATKVTGDVRVRCNKDHEWNTTPHSLNRGYWCSKCNGNTKEQGENTFREIVNAKGGKVIGTYVNSKKGVLLECKEGHQWTPKPHNIYSGKWCRICSCRDEDAINRFTKIVSDKGGELLDEYTNTREKVSIKCKNGHVWKVKPNSVVNGTWCIICANVDPEVAKTKFYNIVKEKGGIPLTPYINAMSKVLIKCEEDHQWYKRPRYINQGTWCRTCAYVALNASDKLYNLLYQKQWSIKGKYLNSRTPLTFICDKGHEWNTLPKYILSGSLCPDCGGSKGEKIIAETLDRMNIPYKREVKLHNLPKKRFDFYIQYEDEHYLIEFDGHQHFEYIDFFHEEEEEFYYKQDIDRIKTYMALINGYKVIRLDYTLINSTCPLDYNNIIQYHIKKALELKGEIYVSNVTLYTPWLLGAEINVNLLQEELMNK